MPSGLVQVLLSFVVVIPSIPCPSCGEWVLAASSFTATQLWVVVFVVVCCCAATGNSPCLPRLAIVGSAEAFKVAPHPQNIGAEMGPYLVGECEVKIGVSILVFHRCAARGMRMQCIETKQNTCITVVVWV